MERESKTILLGGTEYTVYALPIRDSKAWRVQFVAKLKPMLDGLSGVSAMEFNSPADLLHVVPLLERLMTEGVDIIVELLFAYSPELAARRDEIEATATDKEAIAAFREVMALIDPFGMMASFGGANGRASGATRSKSASRSGASRKSS